MATAALQSQRIHDEAQASGSPVRELSGWLAGSASLTAALLGVGVVCGGDVCSSAAVGDVLEAACRDARRIPEPRMAWRAGAPVVAQLAGR